MPLTHIYLEHLCHSFDAFCQCVNLFLGVVKRERGAYGAEYREAVHQRLGAVVACAHCYAEAVEQSAEVKMMD
jgi:hypothetical protein